MDQHLAMTGLLAARRLRPVGVQGAGDLALAAVGLYGAVSYSVAAHPRDRDPALSADGPRPRHQRGAMARRSTPDAGIEHPANIVESPVMRDRRAQRHPPNRVNLNLIENFAAGAGDV